MSHPARPADDVPWFCSWNGGKDSCLALHLVAERRGLPAHLLTMMIEGGECSRSHGLDLAVPTAQAHALGVPLLALAASWDAYRETFVAAARELAATGVRAGVFGDIDTPEHRAWEEGVCQPTGTSPCLFR